MARTLSDCCSMDQRRNQHRVGVGSGTARSLKSSLWKKESHTLIWKEHVQNESRGCNAGRALHEGGAQAFRFTDGEAEVQSVPGRTGTEPGRVLPDCCTVPWLAGNTDFVQSNHLPLTVFAP